MKVSLDSQPAYAERSPSILFHGPGSYPVWNGRDPEVAVSSSEGI